MRMGAHEETRLRVELFDFVGTPDKIPINPIPLNDDRLPSVMKYFQACPLLRRNNLGTVGEPE